MGTSRRRSLLLSALAIAVLVFVIGAQYRWFNRSTGTIRIHAAKTQEDKNSVHWKWHIIGDRRWATFSGKSGSDENLIALERPAGVMARLLGGGSREFDYELEVKRGSETAPGLISLSQQITMQGNNGTPASSSGAGRSVKKAPMNELVEIVIAKDTEMKLPADVKLAVVAGETLRLRFPQ